MNAFDAAIYVVVVVAVVAGFNAGLLRSMATIFGYACAMPIGWRAHRTSRGCSRTNPLRHGCRTRFFSWPFF
jgi:hypothetical protein